MALPARFIVLQVLQQAGTLPPNPQPPPLTPHPMRRRRVGRWLTDVSALRPLLLPVPRLLRPQCTFTLQAAAWAGPWYPTLSLRFSSGPTEVRPMAEAAVAGAGGVGREPASSGSSTRAAEAPAHSMPPSLQQTRQQ